MLRRLKSITQSIARGLAQQDLGELAPTADKISQIEKRSRLYRRSGGQGRIVLIASMDPLGPVFDFVVDLAEQTGNRIEVLYVRPADNAINTLYTLLNRLADLGRDFQVTFLAGDLHEKISEYNAQRQDIMAVVCSASEELVDSLRPVPETLDACDAIELPSVLFVGDEIMA